MPVTRHLLLVSTFYEFPVLKSRHKLCRKAVKIIAFSQTEPNARPAAVVFFPHILYNMGYNFSSGRETAFPFRRGKDGERDGSAIAKQ